MTKIVLNICYGGFSVSDEVVKLLGLKDAYDDIDREDERLVELVEKDPEKASGEYSRLKVVTIPDNYTDWEILEEDGWEELIYVVKGRIYHAWE